MPKLSLAFFTVSPLYAMIGMGWGVHMGMTHNFLMAPAHAHLNLLGFVGMAVMGAFYALSRPRASYRLGWTNFALSNIGLLLMVPGIALELADEKSALAGTLLKIGPIVVFLGMACFLASVLRTWKSRTT